MLQRFNGPDSRSFLIEALLIQPIVGGDIRLAKALAESAEVAPFPSGSGIVLESAPDNDLYFILAGTVSIQVFGREIAVRTAGQHSGRWRYWTPENRGPHQ